MPFIPFLLGEGYGFSVLGNFVVAVNPDKFSVYFAHCRNLGYDRRNFVKVVARSAARRIKTIERIDNRRRTYHKHAFFRVVFRIACNKRNARRRNNKNQHHRNDNFTFVHGFLLYGLL